MPLTDVEKPRGALIVVAHLSGIQDNGWVRLRLRSKTSQRTATKLARPLDRNNGVRPWIERNLRAGCAGR